jgi:hemoglobin
MKIRFAHSLTVVLLYVLSTAMPVSGQTGSPQEPLYSRLGGYDVIARVVDDFLVRFDADTQLAPFLGGINAPAGARIRQHFVDFICARTGGPCLYNGRHMKATHEGLPITATHFQRVIQHFDTALEAQKVAAAAKNELLVMLRSLEPQIVSR